MHATPTDARSARRSDLAHPHVTRLIAPWVAYGMALLIAGGALAAQPWEREFHYGVDSIYSGLVWSDPFPGTEKPMQHTSIDEHIALRNWQEQQWFDQCVARANPYYNCSLTTWKDPYPAPPPFDQTSNGEPLIYHVKSSVYQEIYSVVNGTEYHHSSTSAGGVANITRTAICPKKSSKTTTGGPKNKTEDCVLIEPCPTLQCPNGGGSLGNPVKIYDGTKTEFSVDYVSADGLLKVERQFLGPLKGWRMADGARAMDIFSDDAPAPMIHEVLDRGAFKISVAFPYLRKGGGEFRVINNDGTETLYIANADGSFPADISGDRIERLPTLTLEGAAWRRTSASGKIHEYGMDGRLRRTQSRTGGFVNYVYSGDQLLHMEDSVGRRVLFRYNNAGLVDRVTRPDGLSIDYQYDSDKRLVRVIHADGSSRQYLYNEAAYLNGSTARDALTGAIDENGTRIGTYRYNGGNQATSTESAGGANKYSFWFSSPSSRPYTRVTSPGGATTYYYFTPVNGYMALAEQSQPGGSGCGPASAKQTYDAVGNVTSRTDFAGAKTCYTYEPLRNLESSRIEGLTSGADCATAIAGGTLSAGERKISTEWHPSWRLPLRTSEPKRITTYTYDERGNMTSRTLQPTTDETGTAGFTATADGPARTWRYTYDALGHMLSEDGPRTDVSDVSTFEYWPIDAQCPGAGEGTGMDKGCRGQLRRATNAAGHGTDYLKYNAHGQLLARRDPDGNEASYSYDLRQRLTQRTEAGMTTRYEYDKRGLLTWAVLPDGGEINYQYDGAHRLTGVSDGLGNRISYTLDAAGNRTAETVTDASQALFQKVTREFDALSRMQRELRGEMQ